MQIKEQPHGALVTHAGLVAKGVDLVFFKAVYEHFEYILRHSRLSIVKEKMERLGKSVSFMVGFVASVRTKMFEDEKAVIISAGEHPRALR